MKPFIYRDRYGNVVRVEPLNDFVTDAQRFITGIIGGVNQVQLPQVQTQVSISPETQQVVKQLQKTLLWTGGFIAGAIILNKIL